MALGQSLAHFAVCSPGSGCKEHGWTSEHHPGGHHAPTATRDPQCEPATVKSDFWCCYCLWARLLSMDQWKSLSLLPWTRWGSTQLLWRLHLDRCHCTQHSCTSRGMARWKASAVLALCCKGWYFHGFSRFLQLFCQWHRMVSWCSHPISQRGTPFFGRGLGITIFRCGGRWNLHDHLFSPIHSPHSSSSSSGSWLVRYLTLWAFCESREANEQWRSLFLGHRHRRHWSQHRELHLWSRQRRRARILLQQ